LSIDLNPPAVRTADRHVLEEVIQTVSSTLDLRSVLDAVVDLLTEATQCHACYVFLADEFGRMQLSACSKQYSAHVGKIAIARGEGVAGWVAEHREPVFISQDATSDPRMKAFPEFEEDKYQSLVSVPLIARDSSVLGVVALHAEAPHEYSEADAQFLASSAALVAGAIENAKLHQETRERVRQLEQLYALTEDVAGAETLDQLLPPIVTRAVALLRVAACEMYLLEPDGERLRLRAAAPAQIGPRIMSLQDVSVALAVSRTRANDERNAALSDTVVSGDGSLAPVLNVPLVVSGELLGLLVVRGHEGYRFGAEQRDLAATLVAQTALAVKKIQLVERLSERNRAKDFFDDAEAGVDPAVLDARARRLRCDLSQPRVVLMAAPAADPDDPEWAGQLEASLAAAFRGALIERSDAHLRAVLPATAIADGAERLREIHAAAAPCAFVGVSSACRGPAALPNGFAEARMALDGARVVRTKPAVVAYEQLGPYKYLLRLALDPATRDQHRDALRPLLEYDDQHRSQLFHTLEEYLRQRGRVATTAAQLYVHPNTLRQRLARIEAITGLDLEREDALTVEMAMKLLRLERAQDQG
jgi:GAF domain-containing protein